MKRKTSMLRMITCTYMYISSPLVLFLPSPLSLSLPHTLFSSSSFIPHLHPFAYYSSFPRTNIITTMPPKKEVVPKSPETPKKITKRTPSKSTPSKSSETTAERDLMFLWKMIRLSGGITTVSISRTSNLNLHDPDYNNAT